ncbi:MAG TPA: hypothetical protein VFL16_11075 [Steroidobacteraceae bacterium]|nr:hypothetical protein [Steroidobacteraceae bacterium]
MSAKPDYVVNTLTRPTAATATGGFVINLTSSTTPMALSQPKDPTLAQFTFFVSRRLEDGRERFRLHMGYFETLQAAEEMLVVVRDVYPSAWAGEAPGKKLRPNNSAAAASAPQAKAPAKPVAPARAAAPPATPIAAPAATPVAAASVAAAPAAAPKPAAPPERHPFASTPPPAPTPEFEEPFVLADSDTDFRPMDVPVVQPPPARPVVSPAAAAAVAKPAAPKPAPQAKAPAKPAAAKPAAKAPAKPAAQAKPAPQAAPAAAKPAAKPAAAAPAAPAKPAVAARPVPAKPPVVAPKIAAQVSAPALQPAAQAARPAAAPAPRPAAEPTVQMPAMSAAASLNSVRQAVDELDDLSDTQTIRLLERHTPYREGSREADVDEAIRVIKPEDAQSMLAIKSDVKRNAPVLFAVQLDWSVTAFDMAKIPPLAIFNAYTLYTTEATRDGRTWYGLRLGFFSDAVSAKQVAYYVRSDFKTVSVVPVTTIEKERATDINAARSGIYKAANIKDVAAPTPASISASNSGVFKLLEDDTPEHIEQDVDGEMSPRFSKPAPAQAQAAKPAAKATPAAAPAAPEAPKPPRARKAPSRGGKRDAHAQVDAETLDQTLEILGANTLEITSDKASETGVRHLRVQIDKKGSKFASLIERLSGKK